MTAAVSDRSSHAPSVFARLRAALPDLAAAAGFLVVWIAPHALGADAVPGAIAVMAVEFVLVHASAMLGMVVHGPRGKVFKLAVVVAFGAFYAGFVVKMCLAFDALWPLGAFGWLLLSKVRSVFGPEAVTERRRQGALWVFGALAYVVGAFATIALPLPRLGLDPQTVAGFALPGSGLWIDEPHRVMAFGLFYFGAVALLRSSAWLTNAASRAQPASRSRGWQSRRRASAPRSAPPAPQA